MTLGILLLSSNGFYVDEEGNLPQRTPWDKQFLLDLCRNRKVIASNNTIGQLPKSLLNVCKSVDNSARPFGYDINLGIETYNMYDTDILLITRSAEPLHKGKIFKLDNYDLILRQGDLEIWILKQKP